MGIITDLKDLPPLGNGSVVTMGDFDGLHTGHQVLISSTIAAAQKKQLPAILVTYEPSPKKILKKLAIDSRITTFAEKRDLLAQAGLDHAVFFPVTQKTLRISARTFLREFLLGSLKMKCLIMGNDHHFGHNRRGNARYLTAAARKYGFELHIVDEQVTHEKRTSSSRIRAALLAGDVAEAAAVLGRPYSVTGLVVHGQKRGAAIGFPTANVALDPEKLLPLSGVYAGTARLDDGRSLNAVANLGVKPTVGEHALGLEVHIPDFDEDLYGKELTFAFSDRIRGELRFSGIDELKAQIAKDVAAARLLRTKIVSLI
ncbi:bifunctional riboflavin kinase/FAD synthetase [Turneriella parva]|uniref:Riboflavin biosynthesis protein n=1 Tax=Turneriella parva (strain ATCC BAA-1111 / DSM 21527 / NCTC 11395 / H) TaxID=869212 RepID=I4BB83_TURPD|nr:bifunctional riboflavin kinase/FAD synthetase [Turneriella parva]AFM14540.1 riboflavin biosynthesis protein RibF [Turneriella parva DSM 21527]